MFRESPGCGLSHEYVLNHSAWGQRMANGLIGQRLVLGPSTDQGYADACVCGRATLWENEPRLLLSNFFVSQIDIPTFTVPMQEELFIREPRAMWTRRSVGLGTTPTT